MKNRHCAYGVRSKVKIILSRKGVDSSAGGFASPIFPDGKMISVPIPDKRAQVRYSDIQSTDDGRSMAKLVRNLSRGKLSANRFAHVDPDLDSALLPRETGWRPLFGQCGAAQSHLNSLEVGAGDLFIFFGWFRQVESYRRAWRYVSGAPDLHVMYGWMQIQSVDPVDDILQSGTDRWAHYHPHCLADFSGSNVIYRSRRYLKLPPQKKQTELPGAGLFKSYRPEYCLTNPGSSRSQWRLPLWMHPEDRNSVLSYHSDHSRWQKEADHALLKSAARGQEFVLDLDDYPEGIDWVRGLLCNA